MKRSNFRGIIFCVFLALAVFIVFGQTVRHDFVNYDDEEYFSANPHILSGLNWTSIRWALATTYASNWHPLTWWSLMADVQFFGPGPFGPHLTNLLFHAANTLLVFLVLRRLTGASARSAIVAALFALHPLHVESVAWISERKDVLSAFFGLLTLLMYARYAQQQSRVESRESKAGTPSPRPSPVRRERETLDSRHSTLDYSLALVFFALGLMSKSMLVTLPFVMLLLDYWPLRRIPFSPLTSLGRRSEAKTPHLSPLKPLLLEKLPFLALSAASSVITLYAQKNAVQPLAHIAMDARAANAVDSYVLYLGKMFWPLNLAIPYPHPGYGNSALFFVSALVLAAITIAAIRLDRRFPFLITGWFWYLGMLIPVIGIIQVGMQAMADRYTYLPLIGIFIILVWTAAEALGSCRHGKIAASIATALCLAACGAQSIRQLQYWSNSEALFQHAIRVTTNNDIAHYNLGEFYLKTNRLDEAVQNFRQAIKIRPDYDDALNNLGIALALEGHLDEALASVREAIRYEPGKADAYYNLGYVFVRQHKLDEAAAAFSEALRLKQDYPEAHNNLATVLLMQGHREAAIEHYRQALRWNPNHEGAKRQLVRLGALPPD
ncbi:MAG TPA: tetratricopeptide repeat protein [Verrucomicrobiae bacterium]|nr:tetratricopeptide repeat protein [Verrucomicrobiae bacterium]